MQTTNEKIGQLIYQIRQERGLTQAAFARKLGTSQSAVNRIEHGHQNLSLETLGRISDVLNKPLITLSSGAVNLRVEGGHELHGTVETKTSKNFVKIKSKPPVKAPKIIEITRTINVSRMTSCLFGQTTFESSRRTSRKKEKTVLTREIVTQVL